MYSVDLYVTSRVIIRSLFEEARPLPLPIFQSIDGRSAFEH